MERAALSRAWAAAAVAAAVVAVAWGFARLAAPDGGTPGGPPPGGRASRGSTGREAAPLGVRAPDGLRRAASRGDGVPGRAVGARAAGEAAVGARAGPLRDLFAYADEPGFAPGPHPVGERAAAPDAASPTPTPRPVHLVGYVHRAGRLRAALSAWGEVVLVEAGERVGEFRVLSVDEEAGVRLRAPDGAEILLPPQ